MNKKAAKQKDREKSYTEITTPLFVANWTQNCFKAKAFKDENGDEKGEPKYSLEMIFEPEAAEQLKKELIKARKKRWPDSKNFQGLHYPIIDGNTLVKEGKGDHYADKFVITARGQRKPALFDKDGEPLEVESDFYSGCVARAKLTINAYQISKVNKGLTFYLNGVQKAKDGTRIGGGNVEFDALDLGEDESEGEF